MKDFTIVCIAAAVALGTMGTVHAEVLFEDDFSSAVNWATSDSSVQIGGGYLHIGSDGGNDDWAETVVSIALSADRTIVVEQRLKLQSGGNNYDCLAKH